MKRLQTILLLLLLSIISFNCTTKESADKKTKADKMLNKKIAQFAPTEIKYDSTILNSKQKIILKKLYKASKIIDNIFLKQVYSKNFEIKNKLENSSDKYDKDVLKYFNIMFGPFDRLDHDKQFYGAEAKPLGANFYPENMTRNKLTDWLKSHPKDEAEFTSERTVIKEKNGKLFAVPYNVEYAKELKQAADLLHEAAGYADNPSLKKYLNLRADAFLSNNYFESDMAWMDLKNSKIEITIGPYEVYEDGLFNYKASFESFVSIVDPEGTAKLKKFASYLHAIEKNLPLPEKYKNTKRGSESPIVVVQEVFNAGDAKAGVQTLAFNLPNDERVRKAKGSKKVMLKNIHEAKFEQLLKPIAQIVLEPSQLKYVTFNGFFSHTLMHEMSHGIGPGIITINGKQTTVKMELKDKYSTLEECKADILGMYNNVFMMNKDVYPKGFDKETYVTFLAGIFRSVRFGINEAHGGGNAIIYNYLLEKGGYEFNKTTNKVRVNFSKVYPSLKELANKILVIQATGNYNGAVELTKKYAVLSPSMEILINKLSNLPVDIKPEFEIEKQYK